MTQIVCGVDVSSEALDARIGRDGAEARFLATPEGIEALAAFCREHQVALALSAIAGPVGYWLLVRPWQKQEV